MTSMISKYKRVKITWFDITSSEEAWTHESEIKNFKPAICEDTGYIYAKDKYTLWLFTSYSEDEDGLSVGGITAFPKGCIRSIKVLK